MNLALIGYCGVDCSACADYQNGRCPCCRKSAWEEGDECPPVSCCEKKKVSCCGECAHFPCEMMADFYKESESHGKAYERMKQIHSDFSSVS